MSDSSSASEKVIAKQSVPIRQLTWCSEVTSEFNLGSLKEIFDSSIKNNAALWVAEPIYHRIRLKHPDGRKWIRPMHLNGAGFKLGEPQHPPKGKPLYALDRITANPDAVVSVTGFLIFSGKGFIQILEGPTEGIHEIYLKKICADKRHTNLNILNDCFVNRGNFTDWSMVYQYKDGELSNFGGSIGVDRCRRVARELSFRSSQGERLFSQYLKKAAA